MRSVESNSKSAVIEPLENRRLLAFATVDVAPASEHWGGMAADELGNVYVAGLTSQSVYVRQGSDGGSQWAEIFSLPHGSDFREPCGIAAGPAGDVYLAVDDQAPDTWQILKRPAGGTGFQQVFSQPGDPAVFNSLAVAPDGQAYALGTKLETVAGKGGKTTTQIRWAVWKQTASMGGFEPVDVFGANEVATGIAAGSNSVYAVGERFVNNSNGTSTSYWIVRKSPTGAAGTWTTVDVFQLDAANNLKSGAAAVTIDSNGNVFVAGKGYKKVRTGGTDRRPTYTTFRYTLVRKSLDSGATWQTSEVTSTSDGDWSRVYVDADSLGNVYVGSDNNSVVWMQAAGATSWNTIHDLAGSEASGVTADANDNLYVSTFAGGDGIVRMQAAAAAPAARAVFSFDPISVSDDAGDEDDLLRSL